jgi:hypothetical protein
MIAPRVTSFAHKAMCCSCFEYANFLRLLLRGCKKYVSRVLVEVD